MRQSIIFISLLLVLAISRIVSTYPVFSQTYDEPAHIAAGMEWLERGTYELEVDHPPLGRVFNALAPWLAGAHPDGISTIWQEGNEILHSTGDYSRILALARAGTLPFFIFSVVLIAWIGIVRFDMATAIVAVITYTSLPVVLGHAGLATNDMAVSATVFMALISLMIWFEKPFFKYSVLAGIAIALALLSKFSALVFIAAGGLFALLWLCWQERKGLQLRQNLAGIPVIMVVAFLVIWAGYQFSIGPFWVARYEMYNDILNRYVGAEGTLHDVVYAIISAPVYPAIEFVQGIIHVAHHNAVGHRSYFMGQIGDSGWWNFFLTGIVLKTPLSFLALCFFGLISLVSRNRSSISRRWLILFLLIVSAFFVSTLTARINIGVRHILPVYPFLSIIAACGFMWLWRCEQLQYVTRFAAVLLLCGCVLVSVRSHPDYFAYFNVAAGDKPENYLINSDLDWGQDLLRLESELINRSIHEIHLVYFGSADLQQFALPSVQKLSPGTRVSGWVAISLRRLKDDGSKTPPYDGYRWLEQHKPVKRVGQSINLYHIQSVKPETGET